MSPLGKAGIVCWLPIAALLLVVTGCTTAPHAPPGDWHSQQSFAPPQPQPEPEPELETPPPSAPVSFPPAPLATEWLDGAWIALKRWCAANGVPSAVRVSPETYAARVVKAGNDSMVFVPGSRAARWREMEVHLGHAPRVVDGELLVHSLDLRKTVDPLLLGAQPPVLDKNLPIVIDPGHGGEDSGARTLFPRLVEKDLALDWARRVADQLSANGFRVVLTRTNDLDLALSNRVAIAEAVGASVFVSLHFNSGRAEPGHGGVETYCLTPAGLPSTETRGYEEDTSVTWRNNEHDTHNLLLACRVQRELLAIPGVRDRGVRRARFMGVLRTQQRPAVLVEGGYLSDPAEARLIATPAHRQKLAQAVVAALIGQEVLVGRK